MRRQLPAILEGGLTVVVSFLAEPASDSARSAPPGPRTEHFSQNRYDQIKSFEIFSS